MSWSDFKAEELYRMGLEALSQAEFQEAIELFEDALRENAEHAGAWMHLGICYLETQRPDLAIEALERSVRIDPDEAEAHYLLGNALGQSGNFERAAECYRRALQIDPHHSKAEEFLIKTMSLMESREHYRRAMRILYEGVRPAKWVTLVMRELIQSVAIFRNSPARHLILQCVEGILSGLPGDIKISAASFEDSFWRDAYVRGLRLLGERNWAAAINSFREALGFRQDLPFIHNAAGIALYEMGDIQGAIGAWMRAMELDPEYDFSQLIPP